jgi:2-polyprenyl-3-methyl-5-hydroxy-6-metoxy-1,4-benzoquinol methylase
MNNKIGVDVIASDYWAEQAQSYIDSLDGPYHRHRLEMVRALMGELRLQGVMCLDFGCGEGIFSAYLAAGGAKVIGIDSDPQMIEAARARFAEGFTVGGVEKLSVLEPESLHAVFALNVLAYLTPEQDSTFYRECSRVLKPGGSLVVTHSNELFDLYTLNRYTVSFFAQHFSTDAASLLVHPEKPDRKTFSIRENPLAYGEKLARFGFRQVAQEFASFHPAPPLLMTGWNPDDINARQYRSTHEWPEGERWKLMFQCSMFGSRSVRSGGGRAWHCMNRD